MTSRACVHKKGRLPLLDFLKYARDKPNFHKAGALGMFIGVVRGETPNGETVEKLEVSAEEERTNDVLERICRELVEREGVIGVQIHQFIGDFNVGGGSGLRSGRWRPQKRRFSGSGEGCGTV